MSNYLIISFSIFIIIIVLGCLYTDPNQPEVSIVDFSVSALNKTSNETTGDINFDVKLRNMNKAISLYYVDPFNIAISYYPLEDPDQKYVWEYTLPLFFQGNGKTDHIRNPNGQPCKVDHKENNTTGKLLSFRIDLVVTFQYNYWFKVVKPDKIESVAEVLIDANTGERVSKDSIKLMKRVAASDHEAAATTVQLLGGVEAGNDDSEGKKMI